jgi:hypothetical protein
MPAGVAFRGVVLIFASSSDKSTWPPHSSLLAACTAELRLLGRPGSAARLELLPKRGSLRRLLA